jgi:hypothetical protein
MAEGRPAEARRILGTLLEKERTEEERLRIEAASDLALAMALSGGAGKEAIESAGRAVAKARAMGDPVLLVAALVNEAQTQLESSPAAEALVTAREAAAAALRLGLPVSAWRAQAIASSAAREAADKTALTAHQAEVRAALAVLERAWGRPALEAFLGRRDLPRSTR